MQYAEGPVFDDVPVNSIAVEVVCSDVFAAGVVAEQGLALLGPAGRTFPYLR